jgi:hypothetical protein
MAQSINLIEIQFMKKAHPHPLTPTSILPQVAVSRPSLLPLHCRLRHYNFTSFDSRQFQLIKSMLNV